MVDIGEQLPRGSDQGAAANGLIVPTSRQPLHGLLSTVHARVPDVPFDTQERAGKAGALPLLLLPGTLCDERIFEPMLGPLRDRVASIDTRLVMTLGARTLQDAAEQVLATAPRHFALLGFSLGGMVAMEIALRAPERVRGLALVSTTPLPVPPERHSHRRATVREAQAVGMERLVRERLWLDYCGPETGDAGLRLVQNMAASLGHAVFASQTEMALAREDYRPRLSAVSCPVLVLAGEQDRLCPPAAQRALATALPGCTAVLLPGTGHLAILEKADEVAAAVAAWFHAVESRESQRSCAPSRCATEGKGTK